MLSTNLRRCVTCWFFCLKIQILIFAIFFDFMTWSIMFWSPPDVRHIWGIACSIDLYYWLNVMTQFFCRETLTSQCKGGCHWYIDVIFLAFIKKISLYNLIILLLHMYGFSWLLIFGSSPSFAHWRMADKVIFLVGTFWKIASSYWNMMQLSWGMCSSLTVLDHHR